MAAIEKIRRHSGLLIAIIGIALLAFVLQDLFSSQGRNSSGPKIAVVDGDEILVRDFEQLKDKSLEQRRSSSSTGNLSSAETYSIYNNTLEEMIKNNLMTKEYEAAGIGITDEELLDQMTGDHPHEWVVQSFGGENFDKAQVTQYLQNLKDLPAEYYDRWLDFENAVKDNRLETKFNNLVKASYFLPTALAQKYYENKNMKASADVIALRYTTIPDSTVVVTDADNKAFYEENKSRYETDERRDIEYVVFEIKPSLEDRQEALKYITDIKPDFTAAENVASFVNANSDKRYDSTWYGRKDVSELVEQAVFDGGNGIGYVYGPYEDGEAFNLVRIVDLQSRPDSLKASHILIGYKDAYGSQDTISKEAAEAKANELLAQLKAAKNNDELFAEMASQYNTDATKDKGGDLDWFTDGAMVPEFNQFVVENPVGTLGVVETIFGYHVVKVTGKTQPQPKARLAYLTHEITASTKTYQNTFAEANKFVSQNRTYEQFNQAIEDQGLTKRTMPRMNKATYQITGIDNPREIVRWAFDGKTKKGDVSDKVFELDNMFVVAALTGIVNEGYAPLDVVAEQSKYQILNKKKGEMAVDKMKACGNDVNRMVNELGAESTSVSDITIDSRVLGNFGVEADIVGTLLGMKEGEEVGPIAGNSSAFIIKNVKFTQPATTNDFSDIIREKTSQFTNKVLNNGVYNALRNNAKIKDNRTEVY
ncbi:MAG: peptidylprolyl isomerase [Bacteroidales bacterium]|jgi:peptidyl-prolyl cis-trans isomerase D|nr:peptidylprolyl isomerase [Bacteroidales bacterium]MBR6879231.1 peptidylprolyl isomerase [Bacteroidales bacterium]